MIFNGSGDPPIDKILYERYFLGKRNGIFIESGAYDGVFESVCKVLEDKMDWSGFNIEPNPVMYSRLVKNRPKATNLNCAISSVNGKSSFRQPFLDKYGLENTWGTLEVDKYESGTVFEVETITFCHLIEKYHISKVDLWVLDVEGHEQRAIEGMIQSTTFPRVICAEHGHCGLGRLSEWMKGAGYTYDGSHLQDSFFVVGGA